MSAYAYHGRYRECFVLFVAVLGVAQPLLTDATYAIIIHACSSGENVEMGKMIHAMIVKEQMVEDKTKMLNSLITMYAKCGRMDDAYKVFWAMDRTDVVSWNAVISGLDLNEEYENAIDLFRLLTRPEGRRLPKPNSITFLSVLSCVSSLSAWRLGREVHAQLTKFGLECETSVGNSLIIMYGKYGDMVKGRLVFDRMPSRDVVSWNSLLAGYERNKQFGLVLELFKKMVLLGIRHDFHTLAILLSGLPSDPVVPDSCKIGREIHGYILKRALPKSLEVLVCNALLSMYAKNGRLVDAEKIFSKMGVRDSHSWNAMVSGCSMNGFGDDAIKLFVEMLTRDFEPNHLTFSVLLTTCGKLFSVKLGKQLHGSAVKQCLHTPSSRHFLLSINNALISMYTKCGSVKDAEEVFRGMERWDVFSWTAMITGYAHHGMADESIQTFERMIRDGFTPNSVTFLGLLTACAHTGLVEKGGYYFTLMSKSYGLEPNFEHYACMVDLYGRSGQFNRAEAIIQAGIAHLGESKNSSLCLWKVLLGACHAHKQLQLGIRVATKILELEQDDETTHVLLSNLYASFGMWEDAVAVRRSMRERGLKKEAGCSWVEVGNKRHVFVAGDEMHPAQKKIYEKLDELDQKCRRIGYLPFTGCVRHDLDEIQKEAILSCHSEKLALSFALVHRGSSNGVIRVFKNLRVCTDCHNWIKFTSQVEGVEIVMRDSRRFHSFKHGKCSCGDYW